jgi:hypothetical protein
MIRQTARFLIPAFSGRKWLTNLIISPSNFTLNCRSDRK